jgi:hypothetical protein
MKSANKLERNEGERDSKSQERELEVDGVGGEFGEEDNMWGRLGRFAKGWMN